MMIEIKKVSAQTNWKALTQVFNYYIKTSTAAYPTKSVPDDFFKKKWQQYPSFPFYEITTNDQILGFGCINPFHPADSMSQACTITYFISPSFTGKGLGQRLIDRLLAEVKKIGISQVLASISSDNEGSIRFHQKNGFEHCGCFKNVGCKLGHSFDIVWMQKTVD